jgi:signal transduction histidine kinase
MIRYSIKSTLLFGTMISIVLTALVMGIIGIRMTGDFLTVRFHSNFELIAQNLARNAELGVLLKDIRMLDQIAANTLNQDDVNRVAIMSGNDTMLVDLQQQGRGKIITITAPVLTPFMKDDSMISSEQKEYDTIGNVILDYSVASLDLLKYKMTLRYLFFAMLLAFVSGGWYWFFSRSIIRTLNHLVSVSKQVSEGKMDVMAKGGGFYETRVLAVAFNDMLASLKDQRKKLKKVYADMAEQNSMARVGRFSLMVAHEIKNPLSIIKGSMNILKKKNIDDQLRKDMFTYQEEEVNRINQLVENFLFYSKPFEPDMREIDMNQFMKKLITKLDLVNFEKSAHLLNNIDHNKASVLCDAALMERALNNILKNCFEACGPDDSVELRSHVLDNQWILLIEDSGSGIKQGALNNIFEPFFTTKAKGTGLGLAIVKDIILLHNGLVTAGNNEKRGAFFKIYLPLSTTAEKSK